MALTEAQIEAKLQPYVNEMVGLILNGTFQSENTILNQQVENTMTDDTPLGLPSMDPTKPITANQTAPAIKRSNSRPAATAARHAALGAYGQPLPLPSMDTVANELEMQAADTATGIIDPNEPNPKPKRPVSYFGQAGSPVTNATGEIYGRQFDPNSTAPLPLPTTSGPVNNAADQREKRAKDKKRPARAEEALGLPSSE